MIRVIRTWLLTCRMNASVFSGLGTLGDDCLSIQDDESSVSSFASLMYQVESITEATNSLMSSIRSTLAIRLFK